MKKKAIPRKVVMEIDEKGDFKRGVVQYQISVDGALDSQKFYTMGITDWLNHGTVNALLKIIANKIKQGENIQ